MVFIFLKIIKLYDRHNTNKIATPKMRIKLLLSENSNKDSNLSKYIFRTTIPKIIAGTIAITVANEMTIW